MASNTEPDWQASVQNQRTLASALLLPCSALGSMSVARVLFEANYALHIWRRIQQTAVTPNWGITCMFTFVRKTTPLQDFLWGHTWSVKSSTIGAGVVDPVDIVHWGWLAVKTCIIQNKASLGKLLCCELVLCFMSLFLFLQLSHILLRPENVTFVSGKSDCAMWTC